MPLHKYNGRFYDYMQHAFGLSDIRNVSDINKVLNKTNCLNMGKLMLIIVKIH